MRDTHSVTNNQFLENNFRLSRMIFVTAAFSKKQSTIERGDDPHFVVSTKFTTRRITRRVIYKR